MIRGITEGASEKEGKSKVSTNAEPDAANKTTDAIGKVAASIRKIIQEGRLEELTSGDYPERIVVEKNQRDAREELREHFKKVTEDLKSEDITKSEQNIIIQHFIHLLMCRFTESYGNEKQELLEEGVGMLGDLYGFFNIPTSDTFKLLQKIARREIESNMTMTFVSIVSREIRRDM